MISTNFDYDFLSSIQDLFIKETHSAGVEPEKNPIRQIYTVHGIEVGQMCIILFEYVLEPTFISFLVYSFCIIGNKLEWMLADQTHVASPKAITLFANGAR